MKLRSHFLPRDELFWKLWVSGSGPTWKFSSQIYYIFFFIIYPRYLSPHVPSLFRNWSGVFNDGYAFLNKDKTIKMISSSWEWLITDQHTEDSRGVEGYVCAFRVEWNGLYSWHPLSVGQSVTFSGRRGPRKSPTRLTGIPSLGIVRAISLSWPRWFVSWWWYSTPMNQRWGFAPGLHGNSY